MNFTFRDMLIILSMSTAVILMTFTFTALGLADESVSENDIPEFNSTADNFNLVDEFPDSPGTPSEFTLTWNEKLEASSDNHLWLDGSTDNGTEMFIRNKDSTGNSENVEIQVTVNEWTSGNVASKTKINFTDVGNYSVMNKYDYEIYMEFDEIKNKDTNDMQSDMYFEVRDRPSGDIEEIPIIGGVVSTGKNLYGVVSWIGLVIYWFSAMIFEVAISIVLSLYNVLAFFVAFMHWLLSAYSAVIAGASAWASVFVAIPGILLMVEFTKLILIGVKLLPTT